jgi:DNA-binding response OmpR family regulator
VNRDGRDVLKNIDSLKIDMVLLDLMLPSTDGLKIAKEIRKKSSIPIIMITARQEELDKVEGLKTGADDYITKPFSPKEMVARVNALFRRVESSFDSIKKGDLILEIKNKQVFFKGKRINLTKKEFRLLKLFMTNAGRVFSRDYLIDAIYTDATQEVFERAVDVTVSRLRKKIFDNDQMMIKSVRGFGYKFNDDL